MTYIPIKPIKDAIGYPEATPLNTVKQIATDITYDKSVLVATLLSFGVPANINESLIDLINKVAPISINYREFFTDSWPDISASFTGDTDSVTTTLGTGITVPSISNPTLSEFFADASFTGDTDSGSVYVGGDATNTTKSKPFVVVAVIDATNLQIDSTAGMSATDTIVQGIFTTTISNITDATHIIVVSTSGWVASSLATTF
jgi:hypothetical protein